MIFVNFKAYKQGSGASAVHLAEACIAVEQKTKVKIIPIVQAVDIYKLNLLGFEVFTQHVDSIEDGAYTGLISAKSVRLAGAKGTVLNHSERPLALEEIKKTISLAKKEGLKTLICTETIKKAEEIEKFNPDFIAYEPSELIGNQDISVSRAKPEVIKTFTDKIKTPVLVGAGIHSKEDVEVALKLGAKGILTATDVVLAENPEKQLLDLAQGFLKHE